MEEIIETGIEGLVEIRPRSFGDERGWFMETFKSTSYEKHLSCGVRFLQDNLSSSKKNVLRGLHFQVPPFAQSKLVMVVQGSALDVAVDLRKGSPNYGRHYKVHLRSDVRNQLYLPKGFAHGFVALEDNTLFMYKCDQVYHAPSERTILWDDPELNIDWEVKQPLLSPKDEEGLSWSEFESPFSI